MKILNISFRIASIAVVTLIGAVAYLVTANIVIVVLVVSGLGFLISRIKDDFNWTAFAAIVTLLALLWAVYHQEFKYIINKPKLDFQFFESESPYLRDGAEVSFEKPGDIFYGKPYRGGISTIRILNTGNTPVKNAEVALTKIWSMDRSGGWKLDEKWIEIPLKWVIPIREPSGLPVMTRDLMPGRPYLFNVGSFSNRRNGEFLFTYYISPVSQYEKVSPGKYCFEITAYGENLEPQKRYLYIEFRNYNADNEAYIEAIENSIESIQLLSRAPSQ